MIPSRWRKVLSDLFSNRVRTILVVFSIAVGTIATGLVATTYLIVDHDLNADFQSSNPQSAQIFTSPFNDDLVDVVRRMPGISEAEGRSSTSVKIKGPKQWENLNVTTLGKSDQMKINRLITLDGSPIPALRDNQILIDQSALTLVPIKVGDTVQVQISERNEVELLVVGIIHDATAISATFSYQVYAFVNPNTMEKLGGSGEYTSLLLTVSEKTTDEEHVRTIANTVAEKIKKGGREVYFTYVNQPGRHPLASMNTAVMLLMGVLGSLAVFLGGFLVINTMNALISQHTRQIGVMKAIGARSDQIIGMYIVLILAYGMIALLISIPLAALAAQGAIYFLARLLNFIPNSFHIPLPSLVLQLMVASLIPLVAALLPVVKGSRMTIREAISSYGLSSGGYKESLIDKILDRITYLSRPVLVSLRNTFRRKGRLALTLITLTLGGAIFIAVFNLRSSFDLTVVKALGYVLSDINISLNQPHRVAEIEPMLRSIPGVVGVEPWNMRTLQLLSRDKLTGMEVLMIGPPAGSKLITPFMTSGRWLLPDDEDAIVVGNHILEKRPDIRVGDELILKLSNNKESHWHVVGIYQLAGNIIPPPAYVNGEYLNKLVNQEGMGTEFRLKTNPADPISVNRMVNQIQQLLKQQGISYSQIITGDEVRRQNAAVTDALVYFLMSMAVLIALVGGLGLMGTMSMNVLERTREIGVMRSIGARNQNIFLIVVIEGMLIGTISWVLGAIFAIPISELMDIGVGVAFVRLPLDFAFSWFGLVLWWGIVLVLSSLASWLPARSAVRLTVRDVLNYE